MHKQVSLKKLCDELRINDVPDDMLKVSLLWLPYYIAGLINYHTDTPRAIEHIHITRGL